VTLRAINRAAAHPGHGADSPVRFHAPASAGIALRPERAPLPPLAILPLTTPKIGYSQGPAE